MGAEFIGLENIKSKLQSLLNAKQDALKAAGVSLLLASQKSIITTGQSDNATWADFAWRRRGEPQPKSFRAHQLLWLNSVLLRSLTLGGTDNILEQDDNSITVGTSVAYAYMMGHGDTKWKEQVERPFLFFDEQRLQLAKDAYLNQIKLAWSKG